MTDLYALEPEPELPSLPGETVVRSIEDLLIDVLVTDLYLHALNCVQTFGDFHVAIGNGPFQERLCRRLMTDPAVRTLPWQRTHVWAVADEPDEIWGSRFTGVLDLLEGHSGIPDSNLHLPDLETPDPALDYERRLQHALAWREKGQDRLDLVIAGFRPEGTVVGIAPRAGDQRGENANQSRLFVPAAETPSAFSMTPKLLNATRLIALIAIGEQTKPALASVSGNPDVPTPLGGTLRWYLDQAASPT